MDDESSNPQEKSHTQAAASTSLPPLRGHQHPLHSSLTSSIDSSHHYINNECTSKIKINHTSVGKDEKFNHHHHRHQTNHHQPFQSTSNFIFNHPLQEQEQEKNQHQNLKLPPKIPSRQSYSSLQSPHFSQSISWTSLKPKFLKNQSSLNNLTQADHQTDHQNSNQTNHHNTHSLTDHLNKFKSKLILTNHLNQYSHNFIFRKTTSTSNSELMTSLSNGILPVIMLKMSMDRDEHGQHRIPVLMNLIKLKISDSIHPFQATHTVFRIELEYGDNLLKWVIHRELRDFVNLHAAYKASNIVSRTANDVTLPAFPKTSLPYYNLLKREGKTENKADFALLQREGLQDYLIKLIKATMFLPEANRLCKFLEVSAMSLALATRGGFQGKQGYLRIMSNGAFSRRKRAGFHPFDLKGRRDPKWFIVRESYLISVDEPNTIEIYDIFLVDDEFQVKRPTRLLKQGIHLLDWHDASKQQPSTNLNESMEPKLKKKSSSDKKQKNKQSRRSISRDTNPDDQVTDPEDPFSAELFTADSHQARNSSSHVFYIVNSEREVKLIAKNERQMDQFIASIERMVARSIWHGKNRFNSYAPIRTNVSAQWLIDGRDYFWNLSKAILLAKERIYIHDWWLSPELYLRRPPAQNQRWRLDKLLQRKANEGVQIFVIVYKEVSNGFTPVESGYTKARLLSLSPNIHIQRSPSHTGTGNLLWSHHEKLCVIDETIAFMGGLDLCFGRWDTPGHVLIDDSSGGLNFIESVDPHSSEAENGQIWPGKDYSNQRVSDFFNLTKPDEDMYDRDRVPRQPWHDIGLQLVGQPARDLCRHFVQRWNYLLRIKNHTRLMPFLIPPPDFTPLELSERRIMGTCEAQICRSCGPWSIGTPNKIEHSIQTAYVKAIELSEHFVYIENQFFITSCVIDGTVITNQIGNALVNRIIKAHEEGTSWKAIIIIPTMPGYPSPLNEDAAGSVRLIVECQNRSICRGETSIFGRLRAEGIDPNDYITFFSLRGWGKLKTGQLTTEGVYIHAKAMIVDDRVVIIGSANINERSQRGDRDSELACVIRDTDMIDGKMAGKPYKVGRFAHTMRVRLMREHLGIDVDALDAEEANMDLIDHQVTNAHLNSQETNQIQLNLPQKGSKSRNLKESSTSSAWNPGQDPSQFPKIIQPVTSLKLEETVHALGEGLKTKLTINSQHPEFDGSLQKSSLQGKLLPQDKESLNPAQVPTPEELAEQQRQVEASSPPKSTSNNEQQVLKPDGVNRIESEQPEHHRENNKAEPNYEESHSHRFDEIKTPILPHFEHPLQISTLHHSDHNPQTSVKRGSLDRSHSRSQPEFLNAPTSMKGKRSLKRPHSPLMVTTPEVYVDPNGFEDPIDETFFYSVWMAVASRNTQIFRSVFRCVPDDNVTTWQRYKEFAAWENRHGKPLKESTKHMSSPDGANIGEEDCLNGTIGLNANGLTIDSNNSKVATGEQAMDFLMKEPPQTISGKHGGDRVRNLSANSAASQFEHRPSRSEGGNLNEESSNFHLRSGTHNSSINDYHHVNENYQGLTAVNNKSTHNLTIKKSIVKSEKNKNFDESSFTTDERDNMEEMLLGVQGHLVLFPTRFMETENLNNNFLFQKDRIPPLAIYN
ncbi:hypothetical protein O181_018253 [Austropuccinia psidii MF-1]|uniref:Phospholipase n=1 Tax=Austropuccinia psidii MF-1 TaxID=1389203 RepID=A0A9Q3GSJ0_9BASI|nr:hypothetical protein [Austropuccinia psidii MF-1]